MAGLEAANQVGEVMRLSDIGIAIELIQQREELGRVLFALEHGQGVVIATLDGNGVYVAAEKLPKKFENAIRALVEDVETQLKGYGVDPDTPLMPEPVECSAAETADTVTSPAL